MSGMRLCAIALTCGGLAVGASANAGDLCRDPVVTFTNGMRLPSTCPHRSHNVYWSGDPYHHGPIGDGYNWPPFNSLTGRVFIPGPGCNSMASSQSGGGYYGLELDPARFEVLGTAPNQVRALAPNSP